MNLEQLIGGKVGFDTTMISSTITIWFGKHLSDQTNTNDNQEDRQIKDAFGEQAGEQVQKLVNVIREDVMTFPNIMKHLNLSGKRNALLN